MLNHTYHRIKKDVWSVSIDGVVIGYIGRTYGFTRHSWAEYNCWSYKIKQNDLWKGEYGNRQLARLALMKAINPSGDGIPSVSQSVGDIALEVVATPI